MPPEIANPSDPVTPWIVKWIVFPMLAGTLLSMAFGLQINQWKCSSREAKRQGYLEGEYYPAYRFTPASCVCRKKVLPDGTVDDHAKMIIDLQNTKLSW
jgi:hypothetical protein